MMRFDRFAERAQEVAARAYEILKRYGHSQVDTEHILLALLEQPDGTVPEILGKLEVDANGIAQQVRESLEASPKVPIYGGGTGQVFITPRVKRIIDLANEEASKLKHEYISSEHIFLAILHERGTAAAKIVGQAGLTRDRVAEVVRLMAGEVPSGSGTAIRVPVEISLETLFEAVEQLSSADARRLYERLGKRLNLQ